MGYACPVCSIPQRDGEHLAHHLAFTAMIHAADHEAWLDEHAPGWGAKTPNALAEAVVDHAEPAEYHEVFEDTVDRGRPAVDAGTERAGHDHEDTRAHRGRRGVDAPDPETAAVLQEARELTRQMHADDASDGETTRDDNLRDAGDADDREDSTDAADDEP